MIDANRDGFVDLDDLKDTYASLGRDIIIRNKRLRVFHFHQRRISAGSKY